MAQKNQRLKSPRNGLAGTEMDYFAKRKEFTGWTKYIHYDPDLEVSVIGICLLTTKAMPKIRHILTPEMFHTPFYRYIYKAMLDMFDAGAALDILTVNNWIYKHVAQEDVFWSFVQHNLPYHLAVCTNHVVQDTHVEYWAFLIREQYIERSIVMLTNAGLGEGDSVTRLRDLQKKIDELNNYNIKADWEHISTTFVKLAQHMAAVADQDMIGVPTGFPVFDKITSGLSGLIYLGARPSVGKTALAMKMMLGQASNDIPVGIISLETRGIKLAARMLSMVSGIEYWRIIRGRADHHTLYTYMQALVEKGIYISDEPAVTLADIRSKAHKLIFDHGCRILYIDYLQLVVPGEGAGTREQEVATISRGLKLLEMQTGIPIICLCQLSRESEKRQGDKKKPRLIDLRESGSIEQDADGVLLLHRDWKVGIETDEEGSSTEKQADLIVAKWKDGETFDHKLYFDGAKMEFSEPINSKDDNPF